MLSLTILILIVTMFIALAVKQWHAVIGAGPTILILGMLVIFVYGGLKLGDYHQTLRNHDNCLSRVDNIKTDDVFQDTVVELFKLDGLTKPELLAKLEAAANDVVEVCGPEPTFWHSFGSFF
jgi:hypothetical protein